MKKEKGKKGKREISILHFDEECQNVGLGVPCERLRPDAAFVHTPWDNATGMTLTRLGIECSCTVGLFYTHFIGLGAVVLDRVPLVDIHVGWVTRGASRAPTVGLELRRARPCHVPDMLLSQSMFFVQGSEAEVQGFRAICRVVRQAHIIPDTVGDFLLDVADEK